MRNRSGFVPIYGVVEEIMNKDGQRTDVNICIEKTQSLEGAVRYIAGRLGR